MKLPSWIAALSIMTALVGGLANAEQSASKQQVRQPEKTSVKRRSDPQKQAQASSTPSTSSAMAAKTASSYTIQAGDSLDKIARKAGTTAQKLADANGLAVTALIKPGQKLTIGGSAAPTPPPSIPTAASVPQGNPGKTHTVQAGETFTSIAKKYRLSASALAAANPKIQASKMRLGEILKLSDADPVSPPPASPTEETTTSASPPPVPIPEPVTQIAAKVAETPNAADDAPKKILATPVEMQMTYGDFATLHGTQVERLNALNGLDLTASTVLAKGSELYVPVRPQSSDAAPDGAPRP